MDVIILPCRYTQMKAVSYATFPQAPCTEDPEAYDIYGRHHSALSLHMDDGCVICDVSAGAVHRGPRSR